MYKKKWHNQIRACWWTLLSFRPSQHYCCNKSRSRSLKLTGRWDRKSFHEVSNKRSMVLLSLSFSFLLSFYFVMASCTCEMHSVILLKYIPITKYSGVCSCPSMQHPHKVWTHLDEYNSKTTNAWPFCVLEVRSESWKLVWKDMASGGYYMDKFKRLLLW